MFKTKLEVDKHVEKCLKKTNNETERNLRCFAFAKLYFNIGEYELARRYVSTYLIAKPLSAEGLNLLGKALEKLGKTETALDAYRRSLEIDPKQNNLVIKVCELFASDTINMDVSGAHYYCEKAQSFDPHNPAVYSLKERLITAESKDPNDVSKLLLTELETRPTDVYLRVRLLRHLLQNNQIPEAYKHASDIEQKNLPIFLNNISWYEIVAEVLVRYQRENMSGTNLTWEFWMLLIAALDKLVALSLDEHLENSKTGSECISVVFNFDQTLTIAEKNVAKCSERPFVQEFINHYKAQLCFHLTTLLFKQAKRDLLKYKEAMQAALPLLFAAYHTQPAELHSIWLDHSSEARRKQMQRWNKDAAFRCSQAGHILLGNSEHRRITVVEKTLQNSSGLWREQLFKKLFVTRDQQLKMKSSYFVNNPSLVDITVRLPDINDVIKYDEVAEFVYPNSLHHYVWICLNQKLSSFKCTVFDGLQYSVKHLNNCSAESLNVLDIESFIYCATLTAQQHIEDMKHQVHYNSNKPNVLPAAVTEQLGNLNQTKWFSAAYKMYQNEYGADMSEVRLNLIRGIEVVRCIGNHGLDIKLLVILANTYTERAKNLTKQSEIEFNEARADLYWKAALPLLEKLQKNQAVTYSTNRLFEYKSKEMSPSEILLHIDEGKLFNATLLMKKKEHERALHIFECIKNPYASFYQAKIYKLMADEQVNQHKENVTSEMRSQHIILLSKARDCLYLTLDRLRDPSVDRKHPLNTQLGTEIEKIERLLNRIDPDVYSHRNECDGMSDENVSSSGSLGDHVNNTFGYHMQSPYYPSESLTPQYNTTPHSNRYRLELPSRREARPSPERLDAQLRQMQASRDTTVTHIMEQNRLIVDAHRSLVDELRSFRDTVTNLTSKVDDLRISDNSVNDELRGIKTSITGLQTAVNDLQNFRDITDMVQEMKKEIAEIKKDGSKAKPNQLSEEDLYVLDEEYGGDYGINSNVPGFNPANLYSNYTGRLPGAYPPPALYPGLYPMYPYTNLGIAQQAGLPFGQEAQLPDLRALSQGVSQAAFLQPHLTQNKPAWDVGNIIQSNLAQAGLNQIGLGQPALSLPQPQPNIYKDQLPIASTTVTPSNVFSSISIPSYTLPSISSATIKEAPVNVVITSSDPLPKTSVQTTQILSVTIPPQHLKGNLPPKNQPHNYQIPLPASSVAAMNTTPTIIHQTVPIVSTQGLLSNVSPPTYSAVDRSPNKNTGLGLKIEKSLSNSFNISGGSDLQNKSNVSSTSVDEHDPCPDFKPIVPLPDEVPVNTGEENETMMFCERGKLFRFVNTEWKERGTGNLKILQDKKTKKIRILMRRDQVHKVCANHYLTKDMTLTAMKNNPRAYIWVANDFADEKVVLEKLCVKFKTEEYAKAFYAAFEKAKKALPDTAESPQIIEITKPDTAIKSTEVTTSMGGFIFTSTPTFKPKDISVTPAVTVAVETTKSTSPFALFTFGTKPSVPIATTNLFSTPTSVMDFKPVQIGMDLTTPKRESTLNISSPKTPGEDFEPNAEFKPVVPLPELVETKTGEENAEILFESRAKLLRFDSSTKEWKERGVGIMKVLKESTIRLLMRRDQVHKVCCNHQLLKKMLFSKMPSDPKAIIWYAQDFSEGVLQTEMFAIRFKSEEQTDAFYRSITLAQDLLNDNNVVTSDEKVVIPEIKSDVKERQKVDKKVKPDQSEKLKIEPLKQHSWGDKNKPKSGSWECRNCYIINDVKKQLCVACETPKSNTTPKKTVDQLQLSFGNITTSPLADSANSQSSSEISSSKSQFSFGTPPPSTTTTGFTFAQKTVSWGDAFKPKEGSWECQSCFVRNDADKDICVACTQAKDGATPQMDPNFSFLSTKPTISSPWGDIFKPEKDSWQCQSCLIRNEADKNICEACKAQKTSTEAEKSVATVTITPTITTSTHSWGDKFKPKAGSWECQDCFVRNDADKIYCVSCEAPKDNTVPKKETKESINLDTPGLYFNFGIPTSTATLAPATTTSSSLFSFAQQTTSTFTFGSTTISVPEVKPFSFAPPKETETVKPVEENRDQFVFGSPQKHTFEFTPRSPRRHSSGGQGDEESDHYVEDEGEHIYFKPVIPLPDKIDVKTGEEQEDTLYCHRAKLFRFVEGEWKERGIGDLKILHRRDTDKLRVLMRRDQVLKICLNHVLTSEIEYLSKDDRTWLFSAPDYSEGELNYWQFCLRFKTAEIAQEFKKSVDDALHKSLQTSDAGDVCASASDESSDVEFISETQVTPEEEQEAIKLKLPPKFMAYRQLPDCTCADCKKDDVILSELFKNNEHKPTFSNYRTTSLNVSGTPTSNLFSSPNTSSKYLFGSPALNTMVSNSPLTKSETLKDILVKPSLLTNVVSSQKDSGVTTSSLFSTGAAQISDTKSALESFTFTLKSDAQKEGAAVVSSKPQIFGGNSNITSIFAGSTTPSGSLFDNTSGNKSSGTLFGSQSIFGGNTSTSLSGNIFSNASANPIQTNLFASPVVTTSTNTAMFDSTTVAKNIFGASPLLSATQNENKILFGTTAPTFASLAGDSSSFASLAAKTDSATVKTDASKTEETENKESDEIVLKADPNLTFASIASDSSKKTIFGTPSSDNTPFAFLNSGTPVFGSLSNTPKSNSKQKSKNTTLASEDGEASGAEVGDEYDPHYEPIVPLPDTVVVSTGEEEETPIFNERGKLYRYDNSTKEWKERGVGQIKILYHPVTGTFRFLLRRELVHKLVLNMLITPNTDLQPMSTSDKAWLWCGYNYAEDEEAMEKLAVRFKNSDLAQSFYKVVQETISTLKQQQEKNLPSTIENFELTDITNELINNREDDEDDEADGDEEERTIMFSKPGKLSEQLENGDWVDIADGDIQVFYDPEIYGSHISMYSDTGHVLSNCIIGANTKMEIEDCTCVWKAVEWAKDNPGWRTLKATFENPQLAQELLCIYVESVQFAHESDLVDGILSENQETDED